MYCDKTLFNDIAIKISNISKTYKLSNSSRIQMKKALDPFNKYTIKIFMR